MTKEELKKRTKNFAHACVKLTADLSASTLCNHLRSQLIRSSTSVACNYRATCHAQSKAAFIAKISIVIEENDECEFWLEFIKDENLIDKTRVQALLSEAHELSSIFIASRKTISGWENNMKSTIKNLQS